MEYIDLDLWERKEHFDYFQSVDYPQFDICATIDVTKFLSFVKAKKLPFYYSMIFASTIVANRITNFRTRIRGKDVVIHERVNPSFTVMNELESDLFKYVTVELGDNLEEFVKAAEQEARSQTGLFKDGKHEVRDDLIYQTCIPWISFTHLSHTITLNKDDSIPRLSWGKYFTENEKTLLPFSVQVNHALADGVHIGRYFQKLQAYIDQL